MKQVGMHQLTQFVVSTVRSFLPKKIPKLAMFGPGLESSTSSIVKKILEGQTDIFKTTGMFPGQFGGMYLFFSRLFSYLFLCWYLNLSNDLPQIPLLPLNCSSEYGMGLLFGCVGQKNVPVVNDLIYALLLF